MGGVVVIGEPTLVDGYLLAGAAVMTAESPTEVCRAWQELPADTTLVILTAAAARHLTDELADTRSLVAVIPG